MQSDEICGRLYIVHGLVGVYGIKRDICQFFKFAGCRKASKKISFYGRDIWSKKSSIGAVFHFCVHASIFKVERRRGGRVMVTASVTLRRFCSYSTMIPPPTLPSLHIQWTPSAISQIIISTAGKSSVWRNQACAIIVLPYNTHNADRTRIIIRSPTTSSTTENLIWIWGVLK